MLDGYTCIRLKGTVSAMAKTGLILPGQERTGGGKGFIAGMGLLVAGLLFTILLYSGMPLEVTTADTASVTPEKNLIRYDLSMPFDGEYPFVMDLESDREVSSYVFFDATGKDSFFEGTLAPRSIVPLERSITPGEYYLGILEVDGRTTYSATSIDYSFTVDILPPLKESIYFLAIGLLAMGGFLAAFTGSKERSKGTGSAISGSTVAQTPGPTPGATTPGVENQPTAPGQVVADHVVTGGQVATAGMQSQTTAPGSSMQVQDWSKEFTPQTNAPIIQTPYGAGAAYDQYTATSDTNQNYGNGPGQGEPRGRGPHGGADQLFDQNRMERYDEARDGPRPGGQQVQYTSSGRNHGGRDVGDVGGAIDSLRERIEASQFEGIDSTVPGSSAGKEDVYRPYRDGATTPDQRTPGGSVSDLPAAEDRPRQPTHDKGGPGQAPPTQQPFVPPGLGTEGAMRPPALQGSMPAPPGAGPPPDPTLDLPGMGDDEDRLVLEAEDGLCPVCTMEPENGICPICGSRIEVA